MKVTENKGMTFDLWYLIVICYFLLRAVVNVEIFLVIFMQIQLTLYWVKQNGSVRGILNRMYNCIWLKCSDILSVALSFIS